MAKRSKKREAKLHSKVLQILYKLKNVILNRIADFECILGFAALYSLGTIISLCGTGFLRGPVKQFKSLADPKRGIAVAILFTMIILTLVIALNDNIANPGKGILCLIFVAGQFLAYVWYCLTFIPYGRETVMGCCKSIC